MSRRSGLLVLALLATVSAGAAAQSAAEESAPPPARLKPSPTLEPPALRPPQEALKFGTERDAVFLRADKLEGTSNKTIEASGNAELRTRRQTILADWLRYDAENDEMWGKGNVTLRQGIDWITGPEARFKRDTETGF